MPPTQPFFPQFNSIYFNCSGEIKKTGSPVKNFVNRLNKAFETENVLSGPKGLATVSGLNEPTSQEGTDAFGASRKLLSSPDKSKNAVRNALDEAALKLSSVGNLEDLTPRRLGAAGEDEWTLSTENPVFSEVTTPREHSRNSSAKNTPAKPATSLTSPARTTPRTPGSAQKEDASIFPRSFPVAKPAAAHGLQGGLAGWMRKSSKIGNEETHVGNSDASSEDGDAHSTLSGGLGAVLIMFLALVLAVGVVFFVPSTYFPSSIGAPLDNFRHQACILSESYSSSFKTASTALVPTGADLVALVNKVPQIPRMTSTNFALSDLRWKSVVSAVKDASPFGSFSSRTALEEIKTARQIAIDVVQTPLKLLGSAVAGVCLAVLMVAAVLQLQGAMPLSALAAFTSFSNTAAGAGADGGGSGYMITSIDPLMGTSGLFEVEATPTRRAGAATRNKSARKAVSAAARSTRRLVSDDVEGSDDAVGASGSRATSSSARKSWRRQDTA